MMALGALCSLVGAVASYGSRVKSGRNPARPVGVGVAMLVAIALSAASLWHVEGQSSGVSLAVYCIVGFNAASVALLWFIHSQRAPRGSCLRVAVGDELPRFKATTADGDVFDSASLRGQRILLKFYRGEWCPFCQAELRRFEALRPRLEQAGIRIVALSKDDQEAAHRHLLRDSLGFTLLCDPDLKVIRQFGLAHSKALQVAGRARVRLFGLAVGLRPDFQSMAAPTTLLVDEQGRVCWVDQTDDYKVRSDEERVLAAVSDAFGSHLLPSQPNLVGLTRDGVV